MEKIMIDFDKAEWMIDSFFRNSLIIAIFLITDGIFFVLNPTGSVDEMGRSLGLFIILASGASLITGITEKDPIKAVIPQAVMLLIGMLIYVFPDAVSIYLRLLLSMLIIVNGLVNILSITGMKQKAEKLHGLEDRMKAVLLESNSQKELHDGIIEETKHYLDPMKHLEDMFERRRLSFILLNLISISLGIFLLVWKEITAVAFDFCVGDMARYRLAKLLTLDKNYADGILVIHSNEENAGIVGKTLLERYEDLASLPVATASLDFEHGLNAEEAATFVHYL